MYNSEDEIYNKLDSSQQLDYMKLDTMFHQENQILLTVGSSKSTRISGVKPGGMTSISTFLQVLFIQYLHKVVNIILYLQPSLPVSLYEDILCHFYKGISTFASLLSSLLTSLRSGFLWLSLLTSLQSEILWPSLPASLQSKFLQSSLLTSLCYIFLQRL